MRHAKVIVALVAVGLTFSAASAQPADEAEAKRVDQLEKKVDMLEKLLKDKGITPDSKPVAPPKGYSVWSNLQIQVYGYIKLDAAFDTHQTSTGNFTRWVNSEQMRKDDSQFSATANQTRLGIKITNPEDTTIKTSGRVEVDFYGNGAGENRPGILVRHAYLLLECPESKMSLLAGQTSDVISPLVPSTVNYIVQWWGGNIGYRRAQIRLTKDFDVSEDKVLKIQAALARSIGHDTRLAPVKDAGQDAGYPGVQARAALTSPLIGGRKATLGVSGHFQPEEYDVNATGRHINLCSWSANVDLLLPVTDSVTVKAEGFIGKNLDQFLGGIGQGIEPRPVPPPAPAAAPPVTSVSEIRSAGGWVAVTCDPEGPWVFNVGVGGEQIDEQDVTVAATRTLNGSAFLNAWYNITKNARVAAEISNWYTQYKRMGSGNSLRFQIAFIYGI